MTTINFTIVYFVFGN